eukprot:TRINITY_DN4590_c0_g1_i1.p1 TRINITY_DN4590_c0_g1~~TRINITY_DN4590_c0_g1_i1.p1  ORF type:complete len:383 (-),score=119.19 TRINITY_DN4590_c0_g1_i1:18-1040(-)
MSTYTEDGALEAICCENIYNEWNVQHLETLALEKNVKARQRRDIEYKDVLVDELSRYTRSIGCKILISSFDMAALEQLCAVIPDDVLDKNGNTRTKTVLAKRLFEVCEECGGIGAFLAKFKKEEQRSLFVGLINFLGETTEASSRKHLFDELQEALETFYLTNILASIPARFLQEVCEEMKIWHGDCGSSTLLAECIILGKHYEPKSITIAQPERDSKPKKISARVKKADLQYWYTASELKEFLEENNLKTSGKKNELAQRIVDFFDPEKENEYKGTKKEKRGRKKRASRAPVQEEGLMDRSSKGKSKKGKSKAPERKPVIEEDRMDTDSFEDFSSEESF